MNDKSIKSLPLFYNNQFMDYTEEEGDEIVLENGIFEVKVSELKYTLLPKKYMIIDGQ